MKKPRSAVEDSLMFSKMQDRTMLILRHGESYGFRMAMKIARQLLDNLQDYVAPASASDSENVEDMQKHITDYTDLVRYLAKEGSYSAAASVLEELAVEVRQHADKAVGEHPDASPPKAI